MKRQAWQKKQTRLVADILTVLLVFTLPLTATISGNVNLFDSCAGAALLSAGMSMPEGGIHVMVNEMNAALSDENDGQPENYVDIPENTAPDDTPPTLPDDLETALATIPEEDRRPIESVQFDSAGNDESFFQFGAGSIRNAINYTNEEMLAAANGPIPFTIKMNSKDPQVLIMHTHSTESYDRFDAGFYDINYPTRLTEITENINAVGRVLTESLNALGINAIQATEYHDYPSYNNSYSRSIETVKKYLVMYPTIKVVLDIHRDGLEREDGTRLKPIVSIKGAKAAQIMIVCGAGDSENDVPNFRDNLKFAVRLQDAAQTLYPGLTRPLYLARRYYNQDLTTGSLLVEVGSQSNTLREAKYTAELLAQALAKVLNN